MGTGLLLKVSLPPLPVKRNENNLEFAVKGRGDVRFVDSSVPPREDKEKGGITYSVLSLGVGGSQVS